ncbi:hypothetical protein WICPIJ_006050, partial [Wickerhamomyces pijperi]
REASVITSVQSKPDEVKQAKDMKRSLSSSSVKDTGSHKKLKPSADSSRAQSPAPAAALESQSSNLSETATTPAAPSETEDEKKARLLKEKIDREKYEAEKEAKRKAREAEYMRNISNVEEQKRRELDVIRKREEEQQKKEAQLLELKKQQEQERKNLMSLKEEYERRRQIREQYPYGLEQATFDDDRTKEDLLPYLPLYCIDDGGDSGLVSDVQVVILLGKEDFLTKYDKSLEKKLMSLDDKEKLFDFLYPFLGDFKGKPSTRAQQNDREVQLEKFKSLKLNWLRKDQVLQIIKQDFNPLYDTIRTRIENIQWSEILTPDYTKQITPVNAYNGINPQEEQKVEQLANDRKIPIFLRNRRSLLKSLVANTFLPIESESVCCKYLSSLSRFAWICKETSLEVCKPALAPDSIVIVGSVIGVMVSLVPITFQPADCFGFCEAMVAASVLICVCSLFMIFAFLITGVVSWIVTFDSLVVRFLLLLFLDLSLT